MVLKDIRNKAITLCKRFWQYFEHQLFIRLALTLKLCSTQKVEIPVKLTPEEIKLFDVLVG